MASQHTIAIYWSAEDSAFIAEVPELSGCAAVGKIRGSRHMTHSQQASRVCPF